MKPIFEWDEAKARENLREHKVSFEEAETVFETHCQLQSLIQIIQSMSTDSLILVKRSVVESLLLVTLSEAER